MSRSPFFFVERYDDQTGKYEFQHPLVWNWNHTEREPAMLFPYNGCHDLFSIVEKSHSGYDFPEMRGIHSGLPKDCCEEIRNEYNNQIEEYDYGTEVRKVEPNARWFTYADMYIYCLKYPKVPNYDEMNESYEDDEGNVIGSVNPPMQDTPVMRLKERVDAFLEVTDGWFWEDDYSLIRIVYWIN